MVAQAFPCEIHYRMQKSAYVFASPLGPRVAVEQEANLYPDANEAWRHLLLLSSDISSRQLFCAGGEAQKTAYYPRVHFLY